MADGENFEEDLFADLYDDNDAAKAPAPAAPAAAPAPPPQPVAAVEEAPQPGFHDQPNSTSIQPVAVAPTTNYDQDDDDDDDVDFNLGGGGVVAPQIAAPHHEDAHSPPYGSVHKASAKEDGKMFIGGLNWETTDQSLRDYFSQFGEVVECTVMRDSSTGRSRGFGFLTFKDPKTVNIVMVKEHFLDNKIIDPKRAIPRDEQEKTSKIFVGGVSQETTDQEFRDYFAQFGRVVDATLMMDKDTGRPRGFGFVTFESEAGVEACINVSLEIHGKPIEVKKAQPRGNMREEEEASKRMKFQRGNEQQGQSGGMGQAMGGANNGMTPQVMAQYFQRMQQYFAMMQSQMAMRGMPMNPAMMQNMMQMQQMQQMMGRGGNQNMMNNMTPQMMQQMQAMQQQMMQQQAGGQVDGSQGGGYGGQSNQQQQQQQHFGGGGGGRRGGRGGGYGGGGYGGGHGGGGYGGAAAAGGGGAQQSWEGMYDDVPQRADGQNAPPANAPTGPKNAGKPGANYRGGGRGGNRGFHPYSR